MRHALGSVALLVGSTLATPAAAQEVWDGWAALRAHFRDVRAELAELEPADLADLRATARVAATECPYRSATLAVIERLHLDMTRLWNTRPEAPSGDGELALTLLGQEALLADVGAMLADWNGLLVDLHVAELGPPEAALTADELMDRLRSVMAAAQDLDDEERDRIDGAAGRVDRATAGAWMDKGVLIQIRTRLQSLEREGSVLIELSAEDAMAGDASSQALLRRGILVRRTAADLAGLLNLHVSLYC